MNENAESRTDLRTTRVFVEGHGCSASEADTEILSGMIARGGYVIVDNERDADLSVLVTCSVKKVTEERMVSRIRELNRIHNGKLVVAGCLPKAQPELVSSIDTNLSMIGPGNLDQILPTIEATLRGQKRLHLEPSKLVKLGLPRTRKNQMVGIVEISSGCLSSCTFCQVKLVKGVVFSYPEEQIVDEVRLLVSEGVKEIWLTSTDNAAYGKDSGTNLPSLVRRVCEVDGDFKVRIGMMNPLLTLRMLEELANCFCHDKVFKFLHLPVQTGSERILKMMQRGYTLDDFFESVRLFRERVPDLTLSTDMIVGFPSETDSEFLQSLELLKYVKPDIVNISRYGSRPGTKAATMGNQIDASLSKSRSSEMTRLVKEISLERNKRWISWTGPALYDEVVKSAVVGRNFAYKPCLLRYDPITKDMTHLLGTSHTVRVTGATSSTLRVALA